MKTISDYITEANQTVRFNIPKKTMDKIYNEVDAYDSGIDIEVTLSNNTVASVKFKSEDCPYWSEA